MSILSINILRASVPGVCSPHQADDFTCPGPTLIFDASVIWGVLSGPEIAKFKVIGPQRIFAPGMLYSGTLWFFLFGALLPIPRFLWLRKRPDHWVKNIDIPLIMGGLYLFQRSINFRCQLDSAS